MRAAVASVAGGDELNGLYRAWKFAAAQWELAENDPAKPEGLDPDETEPYLEAEHSALLAFFAHPASTVDDIALKMRVFRSEQAWQYSQAAEIIDRLYCDVCSLTVGAPARRPSPLRTAPNEP